MQDDRQLAFNSVGHADGAINLWMRPLWLKGDRVVAAVLTPREARRVAIQLLQSAEAMEADR